MKKELKTQAFNAKLKPSLYFAWKNIAYMRREKLNKLVEGWINQYISEHKEDLDRYYEIFGPNEEEI